MILLGATLSKVTLRVLDHESILYNASNYQDRDVQAGIKWQIRRVLALRYSNNLHFLVPSTSQCGHA
jgi:hypothetical protein